MNDLTFREKASWYTGCWAKASSDNSPLSEHPNCLNLSHSLSTSAILTGEKKWSVKLTTLYLESNNCMIKIRKIADNISVESKLWLPYKNKNGD